MAMTKSASEIESMRRGGVLLSRALAAAVEAVAPGIELRELDVIAERAIVEGGGAPSFKGYRTSPKGTPFPSTVCISVNEEIVHGLGDRALKLKEGDIVGLDIGCWYPSSDLRSPTRPPARSSVGRASDLRLCTDMAVTVGVGRITNESRTLIEVTRASLMAGVAAARVGGTIRDISSAIEGFVKPHGYGIVRALVGHGVGHAVHEAPHVPNFVSDRYPKVVIEEGMCLALEPMIALGSHEVETGEDGWCIIMKDRSVSAHFEVTIAVTKDGGAEILTPLPV